MQQLGQGLHIIAMTGEAGLQVIQVPCQHTLDEFRDERLLPDLMPGVSANLLHGFGRFKALVQFW